MAPPQILKDRVDCERVAANQVLLEMMNNGNRLRAAMHAFSQPGDAFVGFNFDPQVHAVAGSGGGFDGRDFHGIDLCFPFET